MQTAEKSKVSITVMVVFYAALALALFTYYWQLRRFGDEEIRVFQLPRHESVLNGTAGNPWQYRILSEYAVEEVIKFLERFGVSYPDAARSAFKGFRLFQNWVMFMLMAWYYRKLGLTLHAAFLGMAMMAWAMTHSYLDSDLQFNTHSDIIFYLLAALSIMSQKYSFILPITILAALNRETSALIPLMLLGVLFRPESRRALWILALSLAAYGIIYWVLRHVVYEPQELIKPRGLSPGRDLFDFNIRRRQTWELLFATLNITPVLAVMAYKRWPRELQGFFWAIIPVWFAVHAFYSIMAETRLFLVPMAIVFIPGAILGIPSAQEEES